VRSLAYLSLLLSFIPHGSTSLWHRASATGITEHGKQAEILDGEERAKARMARAKARWDLHHSDGKDKGDVKVCWLAPCSDSLVRADVASVRCVRACRAALTRKLAPRLRHDPALPPKPTPKTTRRSRFACAAG
jgi:hypothetical protein